MQEKRVWLFEEGNISMKELLGGKGANLAEMINLGLPIPAGMTITTTTCIDYLNNDNTLPLNLMEEVKEALEKVEKSTGKNFGSEFNPLLVSVRSGGAVSMPGMMETVLNLGLNDTTMIPLIKNTNNERFVYDSYRRFLHMFGTVVLEVDKEGFEDILAKIRSREKVNEDKEISVNGLKEVVSFYKQYIKEQTGEDFPQDPFLQLELAIKAIFNSWNIPRAVIYRDHYNISHNLGTAVNIQAMVFGNMGENSATGVTFTRNPSTGENKFYGEYLINAQGEDVVAGIRTPKDISLLEKEMPKVYKEYTEIAFMLEKKYKDIQDMEFTIEEGKLYILQTRIGKRNMKASVKIAVDMVKEGIISKEEAINKIDPLGLYQLMLPTFDLESEEKAVILAKGLAASSGAAVGKIVFDSDEAFKMAKDSEKVILVRIETSPDDIHGMIVSEGILTLKGGMTSHAAVVAKAMGKPCVSGCGDLEIDIENQKLVTKDGQVFHKGDIISINGSNGFIYKGEVETKEASIDEDFRELFTWAEEFKKLEIRANADTPSDLKKALDFNAKGVGLCRTEHMFMDTDRLIIMQEMIMAQDKDKKIEILDKLFPMQYEDFKEMFMLLNGLPITIRLLDPPLHEFLPAKDILVEKLNEYKPDTEDYKKVLNTLKIVEELSEANPMMGLRGCRLGLIYPDVYKMQIKAIFECACDLKKQGITTNLEIMIPLVSNTGELKECKNILEKVAKEIIKEKGVDINYSFGTMIETPRSALIADKIAKDISFFSFGTNDLTQMTYGFSRDDAENKFLSYYIENNIIPFNPFESIDEEGVGLLVKMAIEKGFLNNPDIKLGICGEHGGDPKSVSFFHSIGLHYVSCSPYRVPIAILVASQVALQDKK